MSKLSVNELLRRACIYAEGYQESFIDAMGGIVPEPNQDEDPANQEALRDAMAFVKQLRAYRIKRWGRTRLEDVLDNAEAVSVQQVAQGGEREFQC